MCTYMDRLEIEDIICKWGEDKYVDNITIFMMWIIKPCENGHVSTKAKFST